MAEGPHSSGDARGGDAELLDRALTGEHAALESLLQRHAEGVRTRLLGRVPSPWSDALTPEDVLSVTFAEARLRIRDFRAKDESCRGGAFLAWLVILAEQNTRDGVRALLRPKKTAQAGPHLKEYCTLFDALAPTAALDAPAAKAAIDQAMSRLPAEYTQALTWCDLKGVSPEHAAAHLGRTPGAVAMLRARAHDRLRELLSGTP
jgi:DNA-directed RNA polymerase specialized sigma24 family protein